MGISKFAVSVGALFLLFSWRERKGSSVCLSAISMNHINKGNVGSNSKNMLSLSLSLCILFSLINLEGKNLELGSNKQAEEPDRLMIHGPPTSLLVGYMHDR